MGREARLPDHSDGHSLHIRGKGAFASFDTAGRRSGDENFALVYQTTNAMSLSQKIFPSARPGNRTKPVHKPAGRHSPVVGKIAPQKQPHQIKSSRKKRYEHGRCPVHGKEWNARSPSGSGWLRICGISRAPGRGFLTCLPRVGSLHKGACGHPRPRLALVASPSSSPA